MQAQSRIPKLQGTSFDNALLWFSAMQHQGLLFHPEDDPADIICIADSKPTFTATEVQELRILLDELDDHLGHDRVIDAAYPFFINAMGLKLGA